MRNYGFTFVPVLLMLLLSVGITSGQSEWMIQDSLEFGDLERTFSVYLPEGYDAAVPAPLLIALHPFSSSGEAMAALTGLNDTADAYGFIVAYPDSAGFGWDSARAAYDLPILDNPVDDTGFLRALIDDLATDYAVDTGSVYLTGMDSGGALAYYAACQMPDRLAGVAIVSTLMRSYQVSACTGTVGSVPLLVVMGSEDPTYPVTGREPDEELPAGLDILSLTETFQFWVVRNGCDPEVNTTSPDESLLVYPDCEDGNVVAFMLNRGGGHYWPKVGDYALNRDGLDTNSLIMKFFTGDDSWMMTERGNFEAGQRRSAIVYVPGSYDPSTPMPVILALHGRPSNAGGMAVITNFKATAERDGYIVVFPEGVNMGWNYVSNLPFYEKDGPDEIAFFNSLLDDLALDLNIDQNRVYLSGFSNGGFMTQRAACEMQDRFAAFLVVGATTRPEVVELCAGTEPVPMMFIHGTEDVSIPWFGSDLLIEVSSLSVPDTIAFWAGRNGCEPAYSFQQIPPTGSSPETGVFDYDLEGCDVELEFYAIFAGGHNWPGRPNVINSQIEGNVTLDINTNDAAWEFFKRHTLDE